MLINIKGYHNETEKEPLWWIPITYTSRSNADFKTTKPVEWMKCAETLNLTQTNVSYGDWVIFNIQQTGKFLFTIWS